MPKHLLRDGGEQRKADYLAINPQGLVPALADDGFVVPQSLAICEYLEEIHPEPRLLPGSARDRAIVRGMALAIACDVHPLNNLAIMQYLRSELGADDAAVQRWVAHWITRGFVALERWVAAEAGSLPAADAAASATARRSRSRTCAWCRRCTTRVVSSVDMTAYPRLVAICSHLESMPAFVAARPDAQPDAEK